MRERLLGMPVIGSAIRMQERYVEDAADNFAASIAFFGFLSLFPIILLALSVLGFFLRNDAGLQAQIIEAVTESIPGLSEVFGEESLSTTISRIEDDAASLLSIGTVTLLFTGLKVIAGAQRALAVVFRMEIPTGVKARLQQLLALVLLGLLALLGSGLGGSIGLDLGEGLQQLLLSLGLTVLTFLVDLGLFLAAYRFLSPDPGQPPWRSLLPGAILAAVAWVALKAGGAALIAQADSGTYGPLAAAAGLLTVLYLAGRVFLYGAELSALLAGMEETEDEPVVGPLVEPRPLEDVAPAPLDLARLAGTAAMLGIVGRVATRD